MEKLMINIENVSKKYILGQIGGTTLRDELQRFAAKIRHKEDPTKKIGEKDYNKGDTFLALDGVSFTVRKGERVGVIGHNGAGKSTLLKLISKVTAPTAGCIGLNGRIASMLEVGTGFHPELTGRENIYMNGAILGMTKAEISKKLDEIVDFSGCERYIDTPVKRYSSGMMVRLGFAVAAHLDPEILVVDEVLAVGDAEFQKKAIGKMQDVSKGEGRTVLFVSHNMSSIRQLCNTSILLENGGLKCMGNTEDVVSVYLKTNTTKNDVERKEYVNESHRIYPAERNRGILFDSFEFLRDSPIYASNENIDILVSVTSSSRINDCRINCTIYDNEGNPIGTCSSFDKFNLEEGTNKIQYTICNTRLVAGTYSVSFSIGKGNTSEGETNFDVVSHVIRFNIDRLQQGQRKFFTTWNSGWGSVFFETKTHPIKS